MSTRTPSPSGPSPRHAPRPRPSGGTRSLASWRRLNELNEPMLVAINPSRTPLLILSCSCERATVTRHYEAARSAGWAFEDPPPEATDYFRVRATCPSCKART